MDTFAERLQKALDARGRTPPWLIAAIGSSKQTIYNILDGTTKPTKITSKTADAICAALEISRTWLLSGKGSIDSMDSVDEEEWPDVMAFRTAASLGDGSDPDEWMETHKLKFRRESLQRKRLRADQLGVVFGRGDSMLPRIRNGDAIMFDRRRTEPSDGDLFVISYDGALLAKQLTNLGGRWFIESMNKDDPKWRKPVPIDEQKAFEVHGKVVWIGSWED